MLSQYRNALVLFKMVGTFFVASPRTPYASSVKREDSKHKQREGGVGESQPGWSWLTMCTICEVVFKSHVASSTVFERTCIRNERHIR
jgi:hypothetical protein